MTPVCARELAKRVDEIGTPEERSSAEAEVLRWGLASIPAHVRALPPSGPVEAIADAVERRSRAGASARGRELVSAFVRWIDAQQLDWATSQALAALTRAVERRLVPEEWNLANGQTDLTETVADVIFATGLWEWDELLYEAAEFGDPGGANAAQVIRRDAVEAETDRALCAILRRCVRGLPP